MIDNISTFSKRFTWLKPLFILAAVASFIVFGLVVFFVNGAEQDIYIIPSIVTFLWSLTCWLILAFFPNVPPAVDKQQSITSRLKNSITRGNYCLILLIFIVLSIGILLLTFKLVNIWLVELFP